MSGLEQADRAIVAWFESVVRMHRAMGGARECNIRLRTKGDGPFTVFVAHCAELEAEGRTPSEAMLALESQFRDLVITKAADSHALARRLEASLPLNGEL